MDDPFTALAAALGTGGQGDEVIPPRVGTVLSWPRLEEPETPHRVLAGGNTQEREDLLADPGLLPYGLKNGDKVLVLPIEEGQRYIIVCKVVEV